MAPDEGARPRLILGTAGHIDHGKTALVRALTGIDTDRLPEEKARGITIELGFAPLTLTEDLELGVVDVPGHEGLVRTMVAGASGIDLMLLVVAADEGVMPQTREHLAICDLLGLEHGVVALTKIDLAEPDVAELAEAEVRALVADTKLAGSPLVRVSAQSGEGLESLRGALARAATAARARTPRSGPARLWVDRCFEAKGFGAIVTGTLVGAPLAVGDPVEILPEGLRGRVRGLESFGTRAERVPPGARCAVNLQGVALAALHRGDLLASPDSLLATRTLDTTLDWLADAPELGARPAAVEILTGTSERRGRLAPIGALSPGSSGFARLHVDGPPLHLLPGDRFVVRGFARTALGGTTLGGGVVLDVAPPKRRRSDPGLRRDLEGLAEPAESEALAIRIRRAGFAGVSRERLAQETGLRGDAFDAAVASCIEAGRASAAGSERLLCEAHVTQIEERCLATLARFHESSPLRPGMPRAALRGALPDNTAPEAVELALARLVEGKRVLREESVLRLADFVARLTQRQEAVAARLRAEAMIAGLEPPSPREWAAESGVSSEELADVLAHLERDGSLVRAPGDLWFDRGAVDELREKVLHHLREHGALPTAAYKELIGTSRKYAVPLMELFDAEHLTVRRGEERVLRRR